MDLRLINLSLALGVVLVLGGCHVQTLPDPNAMATHQILDAEVMQRNVAEAHRVLDLRVRRGEITANDKVRLINQMVSQYSELIEVEAVPAKSAWRYADILRQAGRLEDAETLLTKAVEIAPDEDRRVNDSLQLARVKAMLGKVDEAIDLVRSTFDASEEGKAPIMMATLYEIVPEGVGKGKDKELALLLQETITIHQSVLVDPETAAGAAFLNARPIHVRKAWADVIQILEAEGAQKELREAVIQQQDMAAQGGTF